MRPITGSSSRTSPSSPTIPLLTHCKLLKHGANSTKWLRRRDELTSLPLQLSPPQHLPSLLTPYLPIPGTVSVITPTPQANTQLRDSPAMQVVVKTTMQLCANSARRHSAHPMTLEAPEEAGHPGTASPSATHAVPASPQTGTHAAALPVIASPTALPAAPTHSASPIGLIEPITYTPPSGTPRTT